MGWELFGIYEEAGFLVFQYNFQAYPKFSESEFWRRQRARYALLSEVSSRFL